MDFQLLGEFQAIHDEAVLDLGGRRRQAVLAVLLLNVGRTVSRQQIAEWAWPGDPPDSSGNLIANYVSGLRQALRPAGSAMRLVARPPGFTAELDRAAVDAHRFTDLVRHARGDLDGNEPHLAATRLREALGLWRGTALHGLDTPYLDQRRAELESARRSATLLLARIHLDDQRPDQAVDLLRGLLAGDPGDEPSATLLIRALTAVGDSREAADLAVQTIRTLRREGHEPGPALKQAHRQALGGPAAGAGADGGPPVSRSGTRLNQLPFDTRAFTGRGPELARLLELAGSAGPDGPSGTVVISAIDGMGGVGKTALALHAAHLLSERFPDGQLFVDLQGVHERTPREPGDVLAELLQAFGTSPGGLPAETAARAAAFRDRLAGTRTLLLLDNAGSEEQVRPLLPGTRGCLVLITSRLRLKGLDDAFPLNLDVLPTPDAVALFRSIATPGRVPAGEPLLEEIVRLCGHLPLALRIAAALLRGRHTWTLEHLAARLHASRATLTGFSDGDRDLASVFDLSYQNLDDAHQTMFRYLGLVPGPDADAHAAAALSDTDPGTADRLLQDLVDHNLLAETAPGRYRLHDLLRLHAGALAETTDSTDRREAALDNSEYEQQMETILRGVQSEGIQHVIFGDIFLEDLRVYREKNLEKVGMQAVFPLWQTDTRWLINDFIAQGFKTVTCCINDGYLGEEWAGREIDLSFVAQLPDNVDPCGENGEFHTFCYEGALFKKKISFAIGEKVYKAIAVKTDNVCSSSSNTKGFWFCDLIPA